MKSFFKKRSPALPEGIPREKFILLINLGYDQFKSTEKMEDYVQQGECVIFNSDKFSL